MNLTLLTPKQSLIVDKKVEEIRVCAYGGQITILQGHAPLITTLTPGEFLCKTDSGETISYPLSWGYVEVLENKVNILAEEVLEKGEDTA